MVAIVTEAQSPHMRGLANTFWQLFLSSSCSAASIVEPLHHCPVERGKTAAHLVCRPAAVVACPLAHAEHTKGDNRRGLRVCGSYRVTSLTAQGANVFAASSGFRRLGLESGFTPIPTAPNPSASARFSPALGWLCWSEVFGGVKGHGGRASV